MEAVSKKKNLLPVLHVFGIIPCYLDRVLALRKHVEAIGRINWHLGRLYFRLQISPLHMECDKLDLFSVVVRRSMKQKAANTRYGDRLLLPAVGHA